jgi:hypothetical protein
VRKHKRSPEEQAFVDSRVCNFRCTLDGCRLRRTTTLANWLEIRAAHMAEYHPDFKPRKYRYHRIPKINKTRRDWDGRLAHREEIAV